MIIAALLFFVLSGLLLWATVYANGWWQFKLAAILIVPAFMFAIWFGVESFSGYPLKTSSYPKRALFVWGYYVDPDPQTHSKGAIYLWLILPKSHSLNPLTYDPHGDPRAYKLPYSEQTAQQVQKAAGARAHGRQVEIRSNGHAKVHGKKGGGLVAGGKITAYVLPRAIAPTKRGN